MNEVQPNATKWMNLEHTLSEKKNRPHMYGAVYVISKIDNNLIVMFEDICSWTSK